MVKITLHVDGMACGMCEAHVNDAVRKAFPVKKVNSSHGKGITEIIAQQPLDEEADQFELQVIDAVQQVLGLMGIEDTPIFKRNRVANLKEAVEAVMLEAKYLDTETALDLLPNITVDMKAGILRRMAQAEAR